MNPVRIATRESELALWQARHVAGRLEAAHPGLKTELVPMTTRGDQLLDRPLAAIGGKGLFLKELEQALLDGRADLAVHSMKDVPAEMPPGLEICAVLDRHDPRDALVSNTVASFDALPEGARIGTSSLRRQAQVRRQRPDLVVEPLRGNVQTRLKRLDEGRFEAIILACAGLDRLGLGERIRERLAPSVSLPAVAQGAVGVEIRGGDARMAELLAPLHHDDTATVIAAERAFSARLGGSCQVPLAGHGTLVDGRLELHGMVASPDGSAYVDATREGPSSAATAIGEDLAAALLRLGADQILEAL